ncbi:MAG: molybdopterin-synthase adenylyltransferase MoeB [Chloroflexi bacterium]|uniref:molybdopterin-synthase adenylyltransferase MoeB n=1 Tax=Candidatus Flexifilum breve TaxID=3140694 RepID=UPI0031367942|nr:molybdopterin-synthase adenylyltransferase MoeB [Chloroflexota bacterium]
MQPLVNELGDLSNAEINRYGRHLIMPEFGMDGQRRLKASSVLIIGTGGLGSPLALYLAAAGIGRIGLVDYDVVDETNLQRQIVHGQSSVGVTKVDSAERRLRDLNPFLQIDKYNVPLTSENALEILAPYNVIIDGTDNFPTRYLTNDACVKLGKPNVYGSILRFEGQLSVFYAKEGPCYRCMFPEPPPPGLVPNCAEAGVLGVLPGVIGTMQATEAIKLITGIGQTMVGRMLLYDASDMTFTTIKVRKNPNCPVCGIPHEQVQLIDYEQFCGVPAHDHVPSAAAVNGNGNGKVTDPNAPVKGIDVVQLKALYDSSTPFVLDVRNPEEFEIAIMPDTVKIPKPQIQLAVEDVKAGRKTVEQTVLAQIPRDREVIVHCRSGVRSADVIKLLRQVGWDNDKLINVEGGILAWARQIDTSLPTY